MKTRQFAAFTLAASMLFGTLPAAARESDGALEETQTIAKSPLAAYKDESLENPAYREWIENGRQGTEPSRMDFSYLQDSYSKLNQREAASGRRQKKRSVLPSSYDARDDGKFLPVANQGITSTCWAVAATEAAALSVSDQFEGLDLSQLHLAWFSMMGDEEYESFSIRDPYEAGANDASAVGTFGAWKGPVFEEKLPQSAYQLKPDESLRYDADFHLQDAYYLAGSIYRSSEFEFAEKNYSCELLKEMILEHGGLTFSYQAGSPAGCYNAQTGAWYTGELTPPDHTVLVVGWDDAYPKENFLADSRPNQDGAWLIQNSYGTNRTGNGYEWVSYEDQSIEFGTLYLLEDKDNYQTNYQYDTLGWCWSTASSSEPELSKTAKAANIFEAQGDDLIEAVAFYTTDVSADYTISIYTGTEEGQPESGTCMTRQSGTEDFPGYHTIELNDPVPLAKGERFSVVIELTNPFFDAPMAIEFVPRAYEGDYPQYAGSGNESFFFNQDQQEWLDVYGFDETDCITNVCIKAFANPLPSSLAPLPNVRFSAIEGPVRSDEPIELSTASMDAICYSLDEGPFEPYTEPIALDFENQDAHTISAYSIDEQGNRGNKVTKRFTQMQAGIFEGKLITTDAEIDIDFDSPRIQIELPAYEQSFSLQLTSSDRVRVDGEDISWDESSKVHELDETQQTSIEIAVEGDGKRSVLYTLDVKRSPLYFDYEQETVSFDEGFQVRDENGNDLLSGASIADLLQTDRNVLLQVSWTDENGDVRSDSFSIPKRPDISGRFQIYYAYECFEQPLGESYLFGTEPDLSDAMTCENDAYFFVIPGEELYFQKQADDTHFASGIVHIQIPERPQAPDLDELSQAEVTSSSITMPPLEDICYSIRKLDHEEDDLGTEWSENGEMTGLESDTIYEVSAYYLHGRDHFYSSVSVVTIQTAPDTDLLDTVYRKCGQLDPAALQTGTLAGLYKEMEQAKTMLLERETIADSDAFRQAVSLNRILLEQRLLPDKERLEDLSD